METVKLNIHQELKLHLLATEQWTRPRIVSLVHLSLARALY
jgi:hypothetical protein